MVGDLPLLQPVDHFLFPIREHGSSPVNVCDVVLTIYITYFNKSSRKQPAMREKRRGKPVIVLCYVILIKWLCSKYCPQLQIGSNRISDQ